MQIVLTTWAPMIVYAAVDSCKTGVTAKVRSSFDVLLKLQSR